jgi:excisionase family DNA binding protein
MSAALTISEIAKRENISTYTIRRAIKGGHLRAHRIGARGDYRIYPEDVAAWLAGGAPTHLNLIVDPASQKRKRETIKRGDEPTGEEPTVPEKTDE